MTYSLNTLQATILFELINKAKPLSAEQLAGRIGVSTRVVRHNISAINNWLPAQLPHITLRPKHGYILDVDDQTRKILLNELSRSSIRRIYLREERIKLLCLELLSSSDYLTLDKLSQLVSISRSTLIRELNVVESWLREYEIILQKRPRLGIRVIGQELSIRHTLILLVMTLIPEVNLMKLIQWGIKDINLTDLFLYPLRGEVLKRLNEWDLQRAVRVVSRLEKIFHLNLSDNRFIYLTLYWALLLVRSKQGQIVSVPNEYRESALSQSQYYLFTEIVAKTYGRDISQLIPRSEIMVFLLKMLSSPSNSTVEMQRELEELQDNDMHVYSLANRLVNSVTKRIGYSINNHILLDRLVKHLSKMLIRLKYELPIDNPFTEEIIRNFPQIWEATAEAVDELSEELGTLSREEISFLAMYFVLAHQLDIHEKKRPPRVIVVCPTAGVTAWMLVSRLKAEIPQIEIVANVSLREIARIDKANIDAIITTAYNVNVPNIPVICVSPFLNVDEVHRIKSFLNL